MNQSNYRISLNINGITSPVTLSLKRGETGRVIHITLIEYGKPYQISENCHAYILLAKENGASLHHNCIIQDNTVQYVLEESTTSTTGNIRCEVMLLDNNGQKIVSSTFSIVVYDTVVSEEEVENSNEFKTLSNLIASVNHKLESGGFTPNVVIGKVESCESDKEPSVSVRNEGGLAILDFVIPLAEVEYGWGEGQALEGFQGLLLYERYEDLANKVNELVLGGAGGSGGGTTVTVGGVEQSTWSADTKVDIVTNAGGYLLYGQNGSGVARNRYFINNDAMMQHDAVPSLQKNTKTDYGMVDKGIVLTTGTPINDYHATPKKYVDERLPQYVEYYASMQTYPNLNEYYITGLTFYIENMDTAGFIHYNIPYVDDVGIGGWYSQTITAWGVVCEIWYQIDKESSNRINYSLSATNNADISIFDLQIIGFTGFKK